MKVSNCQRRYFNKISRAIGLHPYLKKLLSRRPIPTLPRIIRTNRVLSIPIPRDLCYTHSFLFRIPCCTKYESYHISESLKKDTASLRPNRTPPKVSLFTTDDRCSLVVTGFDASKVGLTFEFKLQYALKVFSRSYHLISIFSGWRMEMRIG